MKKILLLLAVLFVFAFSTPKAVAQENFSTDYNVSYNVSANGLTHVIFKIILTNKTPTYYASYYKVQLGVSDIKNVKASDGEGAITAEVTHDTGGATVGIPFNQKVVGLGSKLTFNLSFDTKDIAQNLGKILEVNIPGLSNQDDFASFSMTVNTPASLGVPAYIKPAVINASSNNLTFTKDNLGKSGVYIAYGSSQTYSFDLTYHLYNNNLFKVKTEIAIPPKTNYQDIDIEQISPAPNDVIVDSDGNWLAQYVLNASQKLDVRVIGKARLHLIPQSESLSSQSKAEYLKQKPYWESESAEIKKLAKELKTPQAIYDYVVKTLKYDYSRVSTNKPRLGAQKVMAAPASAVCLEFTDFFIALSRAAGIPAREVNGYAYTQNARERPLSLVKDILHAWPQYYNFDRKAWIMIDPTWGNTTGGVDYFHTLDFDHLAFVIKGKGSSYPVPAGGYKLPGQENKKDVIVNVSSIFEESFPTFNTELTITKSPFPWEPILGKVVIRNDGSQMSDPQTIEVDTNVLSPKHQKINVGAIPPYGKATIPLRFATSSLLTNREDTVKITLGQKTITQKVLISPFNFSSIQLLAIGGVSIVIFAIIISAIATKFWHLHISRREAKRALRGKGQ